MYSNLYILLLPNVYIIFLLSTDKMIKLYNTEQFLEQTGLI